MVRAAGGVMLRDGLVAVVHRPHRRDWTLPKGKLEAGEDDLAAAVREVCEETGWLGEPDRDLGVVEYGMPDGRTKSVRWYLMRALQEVAQPTADVDEVRWLQAAAARELLTYDLDREVLGRAGL
jgi:8-oxo-dGTP pyrophosphatase MutT (NUDIX family)